LNSLALFCFLLLAENTAAIVSRRLHDLVFEQ